MLVGDDLFFRDMNAYTFDRSREIGLRTLPYTASRLGLLQEWDRLVVKPEATYYRNLTSTQSAVLQRAPALDVWGQLPLGQVALGELDTSAVDYQRGSSVTGMRFDFKPGLFVPLPLGPLAFGSVNAALRGTAYHLFDTQLLENEQPPEISGLPRNQTRGLVEVR